MKSSGEYFIALDHVRAFAALMVFSWHFVHVNSGQLATASPLLALFAEGHTGVSLFMVLPNGGWAITIEFHLQGATPWPSPGTTGRGLAPAPCPVSWRA